MPMTAFQLPNSYMPMSMEEMEYLDGGGSVANWIVSGAINVAAGAAFGGLGKVFFSKTVKSFGEAKATLFASNLKTKLIAMGVASGVAATICAAVPTALTFFGDVMNPGGVVSQYLDKHDKLGQNGQFDF